MITNLARRLGFSTSVPVSALQDWILPATSESLPVAPRGGAATALVDRSGRVQPAHHSWTLDWTLKAGARWVSAIEADRISQKVVAPAVVETTIETPAGPVVQRVVAAVVGGEPVAIIEFENLGGVAIAVGVVARPLIHSGRGFLERASANEHGIDLGQQGAVRYERAVATSAVDSGDLLASMPPADAGLDPVERRSRIGSAQAAAVFPVPHTAKVRVVVELGERLDPSGAIPGIDDVVRGWAIHLDTGARYSVGETDVDEKSQVAAQSLLTSWPERSQVASGVAALAELGFGVDARRHFDELENIDRYPELLGAMARWAQLGRPEDQLEELEGVIGPIARAAQLVDGTTLAGEAWLPGALAALAQRLDLIGQDGVGDRVRSLKTRLSPGDSDIAIRAREPLDSFARPENAAPFLLGLRSVLMADSDAGIDVLPHLPESWRGRSIDVLGVPVQAGAVSFGVRWHGPRPALLWELDDQSTQADQPRADQQAFRITASAIDPAFSSTEHSGEALLAEPGWPKVK